MACILVDLGFSSDINLSEFEGFAPNEIEFLINANKDVNTLNLRKKLDGFNCYIFEPTLYIDDEGEIKKLKEYFLKNTNSDFLVSYDKFNEFKMPLEACKKDDGKRANLAFFSPLPNEKTGVSFYSVELLEELIRYYEITVFVENLENIDKNLEQIYEIKEASEFLKNPYKFDRILYQMGGSHYHLYMYEIMKKFEGIVVFHDFYMSQLIYTKDTHYHNIFFDELYASHGYEAISFYKANGLDKTVLKYPANKTIIDASLGVIAHSNEPKRILEELYGGQNDIFEVIPLLRKPARILSKEECKKRLNLPEDKLLICSFGYVNPTKLGFNIIRAFNYALTAFYKDAMLVLVGACLDDSYKMLIEEYLKKYNLQECIKITGWIDDETYTAYLDACDVAIQLRSHSRGETSAAVLDCFNHALPVLVNKHGSMKDLPKECVYFIEDKFSPEELCVAIDDICIDTNLRRNLAKNAKECLNNFHTPEICAKKYYEFIEKTYAKKPLLKEILADFKDSKTSAVQLARAIASIKLPSFKTNKIFIDITEIYRNDLKTGIQRVVRSQLFQLLWMKDLDYQIEPIYYDNERSAYFCAKDFMQDLYAMSEWNTENEVAQMSEGDIFYGLDCTPAVIDAGDRGIYARLRAKGIKIFFVIYDIIPIAHPYFFPPEIFDRYVLMIKTIANSAEGIICISDAVVDDVKSYILENALFAPPVIKSMKLGCDIKSSKVGYGLDKGSIEILDKIRSKPTFIMVGTLEPRKGHDATIRAFETLWQKGLDVNLLIAGKVGWMVDELYESIKEHEENGKRLIFLDFISDEMLDEIYKNSSCLIAASRAEGFGLPLVEAAIHKIPIITRDIKVFREVSNGCATYFADDEDLPCVIEKWLVDFKEGEHIKPDGIKLVSWRQSSEQAYQILTGEI